MNVTVAVFKSKAGDEFIVPGCWYDSGPDSDMAGAMFDAMTYSVVLNCTSEWAEFPVVEGSIKFGFPVKKCTLLSRAFAHGGIDVYLTAGPMYDKTPENSK